MAHLAPTFRHLADQFRQLGLNLSLWEPPSRLAGVGGAVCEFCRVVQQAADSPRDATRSLAEKIMADQAPAIGRAATGCCLIGVPVHRRRRLVGAAVGCFPVREMAEEEHLARMCDRMQLDRQAVATLMADGVTRSLAETDDLLVVMTHLLAGQQALQVAQDEMGMLSANLTTTYEELSLLYRISGSMKLTGQPGEFMQNVCEELLEVANIQAAVAIVYGDPRSNHEGMILQAGECELDEEQMRRLASTHIAPRLAAGDSAVVDNQFPHVAGAPFGPNVRNYVAAPLAGDAEAIGMLIGLNKLSGEFDSVDMKLLSSVGNQSAVFIVNHRLYEDVQDLLMGVLHALTAAIDAKDPYTCGHSQRVAMISRRIALSLGFDRERVRRIHLAGLLHDVGKIGVPEAILCKPGKLTAAEYEVVKTHPSVGGRILGGIRRLDDVVEGIIAHHERPDGKGYPRGLAGDEVPIEGLIIGLADSFDAMTSTRTYRDAMAADRAVAKIRRCAGAQFDEKVVEAFLLLDPREFMAEVRASIREAPAIGPVQEYRS